MLIKRTSILLAILAVFTSAMVPCMAATIGNVSSWSRLGQDVTFNITDGSRLKLSVLNDDLVRFRFAPNGLFTDNISQAVVATIWPSVSFTTEDYGSIVRITTAELVVDVYKIPCYTVIKDLAGNIILRDDSSRRIEWGSGYTKVYKSTVTGESYLGLGWRPEGGIRRNGTSFTMRNVPTYNEPGAFYGGVPFWYGIREGKAYGVFFDDTSWGEINVGAESSNYMYFSNLGGQVDYYFFYGPDIEDILDRYTQLTGRPFMPPKWACGYQQSRWSYTPQTQVLYVAGQFRSHNIPCDAIYLDIDYMNEGQQLTFNPTTFPDPGNMCSSLHSQGFHVVANISPWLLEGSSTWHEANNNGYLIKNSDGSVRRGWHDYVYFCMGAPTGWVGWVDFTNSAARNWYAGEHTSFLSNGIDGIWNDLNEPQELGGDWPSDVKYSFDGQNIDHSKTSTQYCVIQSDFSYDVLRNQYPNKRPFVLSRGAYAGIQRSAAIWSGDNTSDWTNDFKRNIPMGLSMSLSGQPHNGHDIGGFYGYPDFSDPISGELFARWMQAGVFSAFCRGHHHGNGIDNNYPFCEPWQFGTTVEAVCRGYINLRYQLMPYLYSLFYQAHTTGAPIQRPTVYDFQNDPNTLNQDYDFMFGPFMLAAPVYTQGASTRYVYLPAGTGWIDWWNDARYNGGNTALASTPITRMPIYVREGAIIPMGPVMQYADAIPLTELTLRLYPAEGISSSFTMFEDDGASWNYQSGAHALTTHTMDMSGGALTFDIGARSGSYTPPARHWTAEIRRWSDGNVNVRLNDAYLPKRATKDQLLASDDGWYYDSAYDVLYVRSPDSGQHMVLTVEPDTVPPEISEFQADSMDSSGAITFRATCADYGAGMQKVEFRVNASLENTVYGTQPNDYYYFQWTPTGVNPATIEAKAYDNLGNYSTASLVVNPADSLADVKSHTDGTFIYLSQATPVTAVFATGDPPMKARYLYIEDTTRTSGLRVRTDNASAVAGNAVRIMGVLRTVALGGKPQGERYIDASAGNGSITVAGTTDVPKPLGMPGRAVDELNRGLLVNIWGTVTETGICDGFPYFHISDGSSLTPGHDLLAPMGSTATFDGIRVYSALPQGLGIGDYVLATGISSCESPLNFDELNPVLRVDSTSRIVAP